MEFTTIPSYKEIFGKEPPALQSLLFDLPSAEVIAYLASLNTQLLMSEENDLKVQEGLLNQILGYWTPTVRWGFLESIEGYLLRNEGKVNFFKSVYLTYFIHRELMNFRETGIQVRSAEEERIIRAYFIIATEFGNEIKMPDPDLNTSDPDFFQKLTWPNVIKQFDFNESLDPVYQAIRLGKFLEHFYLKPEYKIHVEKYLRVYDKTRVYNFVMDFINVINVGLDRREDSKWFNSIIHDTPGYRAFLEAFTINPKDYGSRRELQVDYLGMRAKPLVLWENKYFIVTNWKFFYASIYMGVVFDFCRVTQLKFPDIKKIVGEEITPKILSGILKYAFKEKHRVLFNDVQADANEGYPDFYVRDGKYIYLFELKDYIMTTDVIGSNSFDAIKSFFDIRFCSNEKGRKKGLLQLLEQFNVLNGGGFDFDRYQEKGIKTKNLVVIPIIVTTHYYFQMPGLNSYLVRKMKEFSQDVSFKFNTILPVTLIDLSFFYSQLLRIKNKEIDLLDLIKNYHRYLAAHKNDLLKNNSAFSESFPLKVRKLPPAQKQPGFIDAIFQAVEIDPDKTNR